MSTIPEVEALQGRPMYHVTSRGRREENIPFTNMITPNCLQYITYCACMTMYLFNHSLLVTWILFPTCECESINIYSRLPQGAHLP